jgi:integrase
MSTVSFLQHTFGHIDCPACDATNPMGDDPDGLADMLFPAAAKRWLATRKPYLRARTHYEYGQCIKRLNVFFHALPLRKIRLGHLRQYQVKRGANDMTLEAFIDIDEVRKLFPDPHPAWPKPAGYSQVNHELSVMQSVLKRAGLWGPFKEKYEAVKKTRTKKPKTLTDEQSLHLVSKAMGRPAWELAFWIANITENTSAAGTELRHLLLEDIHDQEELPWIRIDDESAKNDFRGRVIYLNPTALHYIRKCKVRAITLGCNSPKHYLFPYRVKPGVWDPTRPAGSSWTRRCFASMRKATDLDFLTPHCFRHQCATLLFESGADDMTLIHTLGHASINMSRHYSHNRMKRQKEVLDSIDTAKRLGVQSVDLDSLEDEYENKYSMRA